MPKLWSGTIEAHRQEVRTAVVAATADLVSQHGLRGVTMSRIAQDAGIGRATLYKYFPDVEAILTEWHDEQVAGHLSQLAELRTSSAGPVERLVTALDTLAHMSHKANRYEPAVELVATLHAGDRITKADHELRLMFRGFVEDAIDAGHVRDDIPSAELTAYCVTAAMGARNLPSRAAVRRLVQLTMAGLAR